MHNFEYQKAFSTKSVQEELENFYKESNQPKILEIFTPSLENDKILKEYFKYIK
jgi:2-succinyl-5-enolpyruvyl-6-hydroxy-3-cyclohexene-1-carboxylate synthase